jgi:hypothetical protein
MSPYSAKLGEQGCEILRLGDDVSRPNDVLDLDLVHAPVTERAEQIADMEDPDHVVQGLPINGIPRKGRVHHRFEAFLGR